MKMKRALLPAFYRAIYLAGERRKDGGITILSYHSLDDLGTPLSVSPGLFRSQMAALTEMGCRTFTMSQVASHLAERRPFPPRSMAITFDDGFANLATEGMPVLQEYGLAATVYIITGMVGRRTHWTDRGASLPSLPILTWGQIESLQAGGVEVGAHSVTHGFLTQYADAALKTELEASRETLESALGSEVRAFAYPQGDYNRRVTAAVRAAGYTTAVTVDQGRAGPESDPLLLPRLLVSGNTTPDVMRAFAVPTIGPAYGLINFAYRRILGRKKWPRREPGEVQSTETVPKG